MLGGDSGGDSVHSVDLFSSIVSLFKIGTPKRNFTCSSGNIEFKDVLCLDILEVELISKDEGNKDVTFNCSMLYKLVVDTELTLPDIGLI